MNKAARQSRLQQYVGRIVRLNQDVFQKIRERATRRGSALENSFLVTEARRGMQKLICYHANFRVEVDIANVVLV